MKKYSLVFILLIIIFIVYYRYTNRPYVVINNQIIYVDIADSIEEYAKGLSNVPYLDNNQGMLFIFPNKQERSFWMKDMLIPIDLLWIEDNIVIDYEENMDHTNLDKYISPQNINMVLEIPVNTIKMLNIEKGDIIKYINI